VTFFLKILRIDIRTRMLPKEVRNWQTLSLRWESALEIESVLLRGMDTGTLSFTTEFQVVKSKAPLQAL
jgi:hypothetical protein